MKKAIFPLLVIGLIILNLVGCGSKKSLEDAKKFKDEYESLNDTLNSAGKKFRELSIDENNPFIYSTGLEIVKKIENKETFYVYFGSKYCPWCRSVIEKCIEIAKKNNIEKIYYVDIWDEDHVEILRDTYKINDDGKLELVKEGSEGYKELLEYLDDVLSEYTLTDQNGNAISVGEKRIFAPNFIYVKDGKAIKLTSAISDNQKTSNDELSDEILKDEEEKFTEFFSE